MNSCGEDVVTQSQELWQAVCTAAGRRKGSLGITTVSYGKVCLKGTKGKCLRGWHQQRNFPSFSTLSPGSTELGRSHFLVLLVLASAPSSLYNVSSQGSVGCLFVCFNFSMLLIQHQREQFCAEIWKTQAQSRDTAFQAAFATDSLCGLQAAHLYPSIHLRSGSDSSHPHLRHRFLCH